MRNGTECRLTFFHIFIVDVGCMSVHLCECVSGRPLFKPVSKGRIGCQSLSVSKNEVKAKKRKYFNK